MCASSKQSLAFNGTTPLGDVLDFSASSPWTNGFASIPTLHSPKYAHLEIHDPSAQEVCG